MEENNNQENNNQNSTPPVSDTKIFNILSYIGPLWLVGIFSEKKNEKDEKDVNFHIGQGILVTILYAVIYIINNLFVAKIFTKEVEVFWYKERVISDFGHTLMWLL